MASFNRVILMGNVTRDPELRYIPSGTAVTDLGSGGQRSPQECQRRMGRRDHVRRCDAVGTHRRDRLRVPQQGISGVHRGPAQARHLGKRRQEEL